VSTMNDHLRAIDQIRLLTDDLEIATDEMKKRDFVRAINYNLDVLASKEAGAGVGDSSVGKATLTPPPPRYICDGVRECIDRDSCHHAKPHQVTVNCGIPGRCAHTPPPLGVCRSDDSYELIVPPDVKVAIWFGCDAIIDCTVRDWADMKHFPQGTKMRITYGPVLP